jgi:hypothetical protein
VDGRAGARLEFGSGAVFASADVWLEENGAALRPFEIWAPDTISIRFSEMRSRSQPPFASEDPAKRDELRTRLQDILGDDVTIRPETKKVNPGFELARVNDEETRKRFLELIEWAFDEARAAQTAPATKAEAQSAGTDGATVVQPQPE